MGMKPGFLFWAVLVQIAVAFTCHAKSLPQEKSFADLVGMDDWTVTVKNVSMDVRHKERMYGIRVADRGFVRFAGRHDTAGQAPESFGPVTEADATILLSLWHAAFSFSGLPPGSAGTVSLSWLLYPGSILEWAKTWQQSELRRRWEELDPHYRYKKLTESISVFMKKSFLTVFHAMGMTVDTVSMEKMSFQPAGQLDFFDRVMAPAGVPETLEIPIPLMLYICLEQDSSAGMPVEYAGLLSPEIESFFVIAQKEASTIYLSFDRRLDEFELTGDILHDDGHHESFSPMSNPRYHAVSARLLETGMKVVNPDISAP